MFGWSGRSHENAPLMPDSLRQPVGNPIQTDRLPDTSRLEMEFPVVTGTLPKNRQLAGRELLTTFFLCLLLSAVEAFLPKFGTGAVAIVSAICLTVLMSTLIGTPRRVWHWLAYVFVVPQAILSFLFLREPFLTFLVAAWSAVLLADRFACQAFQLRTSAPMERPRALQLRELWKKRFYSFQAPRGMELYQLVIASLMLIPCVWWFATQWPNQEEQPNKVALAFSLLTAVLVIPLAVEAFTAFLYARPLIRLRDMRRAFVAAVVEWFTYNPTETTAPGTLRSPVGNTKERRRAFFWLSLMFTSFFALELASPVVPLRNLQTNADYGAVRAQSPTTPPLNATDAKTSEPPLKLEPYQQRTLDRMSPADREQYLEQLRKRQRAADDERKLAEKQAAEANALPQRIEKFGATQVTVFQGYLALLRKHILPTLLGALFPLAFVGGYCFATSARVVGYFRPANEFNPQDLLSSKTWDALVERVQKSADADEKRSLLLGVNATDNAPVLVPREVFREHAHILGDSGSGKTSLGISLILSQMIRFRDSSVVVIDLKGDDHALFAGTQHDAQQAGLPFRWFTNELNRSTYAFNPLNQSFFSGLSQYQKTDIITTALGLQYGTDYGRGYFSDANAELLFHALRERPEVASFAELQSVLDDRYALRMVNREVLQAGSHIRAVVSRLAATTALNVTKRTGHDDAVLREAIDFADVFRNPQVVYFHLPSSLGTTTSPEIARIALYALLGSARSVPDNERRQVFVFIDEFQRIIANNFELILQTARSMNIGLILANQSMYDLKKQGIDLIPSVRANTRYKQIFAASNTSDLQELVTLSGERLVHQRTWRDTFSGIHVAEKGINYDEAVMPRLGINDVLLASDHPFQSIVQIRRGDGYAQYGGFPFVMRSTHHISQDEHKARKNAPWPPPNAGTLVATADAPKPKSSTTLLPTPVLKSAAPGPIVENTKPAQEPAATISPHPQPNPIDELWNMQLGKRPKPPQN